jgi:peptidoglycan/LPS O-acetylase OafA/YrhL
VPAERHSPSSRVLTLDQAFDPRNNAIGFLRCLLAALVLISHCYKLGGFGHDPLDSITGGRPTLALLAVAMFFILSGFLVTRSALHVSSVSRFLWHRFLRIFPAYWVCLLVCALVIAPFICHFEHGVVLPMFSAPRDSPQAFILANFPLCHVKAGKMSEVLLLHPLSIAGLLRDNPYPWIINGSLSTLPYEFACYVVVALLAALAILRRARVIMLLLFVVLWLTYSLSSPSGQWLSGSSLSDLLSLSLYFAAGSVGYLYREKILISRSLVGTTLLIVTGALYRGMFGVVAPVAIPYLFLWLACKLPLRRFDARGDFSYGLYIYAFPVQQTLAFLHVHDGGFTFYVVCSLLVTLILAVLSYCFVEAPSLKLKNLGARSGGIESILSGRSTGALQNQLCAEFSGARVPRPVEVCAGGDEGQAY